MRTRFAPTPSGYLHQGNLANALVNSWLAQQLRGEMVLRIDDDDEIRVQAEYKDFIFESLRILDVDFMQHPTEAVSRRNYLKSQLTLIPGEFLFACDCSRSALLEQACACRDQQLPWQPGVNALRLHIDRDTTSHVDGQSYTLNDEFGDVVLWRRDDIPAYHWANVIDDRDLEITHIVRGRDLQPSSALHIHIARLIGADNVSKANYRHHSLITNTYGEKLSKSQQSNSGPPALDLIFLSEVRTAAQRLADELGITVP